MRGKKTQSSTIDSLGDNGNGPEFVDIIIAMYVCIYIERERESIEFFLFKRDDDDGR